MNRIRRRICGKRDFIIKDNFVFNPDIFKLNVGYLDGYWQSPLYFSNIEDEIKSIYHFPIEQIVDHKNRCIIDAIQRTESVSIHIRRTDYLKYPDLYPNLSESKYYERSIEYIKNKLGNKCHYFIFSDDIVWCKDNLHVDNCTFIDWNNGDYFWIDMYLMSICKHNIIANSTFSWWSAYLNKNASSIQIAPKLWSYDYRMNDIYTEKMIVI